MRLRRSRRRAFTLVEIMLAIVILSGVIAAIYATWTAIMRATEVGRKAAAQVQRTRVALRCLEESLTYTEMYVANARYYGFVAENGSDASLSFVSRLPSDFPRSGRFGDYPVRRLAYTIESDPSGDRVLALRQAPLLMDFDQDEQEHPLILMRNIKRMEMEFWDVQKDDWTDEWTQTNQMPKLIRVTLTTENPNQPFDRGQEYTRIVAPAAVAVQPGWQARAPGQVPGGPPPGNNPPPGGAPNLQVPR
jgi:type II secretion system protein J